MYNNGPRMYFVGFGEKSYRLRNRLEELTVKKKICKKDTHLI